MLLAAKDKRRVYRALKPALQSVWGHSPGGDDSWWPRGHAARAGLDSWMSSQAVCPFQAVPVFQVHR